MDGAKIKIKRGRDEENLWKKMLESMALN